MNKRHDTFEVFIAAVIGALFLFASLVVLEVTQPPEKRPITALKTMYPDIRQECWPKDGEAFVDCVTGRDSEIRSQ